jgi:tRNA (guanine37-N1)-methyltransferase
LQASRGIRVRKDLGEKALQTLRNLNLLDPNLRVRTINNHLIAPILREPSTGELEDIRKQFAEVSIETTQFQTRKIKSKTIFDILEDQLPPHLLASLPKSVDIIGQVAIIEIPVELQEYKGQIGEAILEVNSKVQTVLAKAGPISEKYRIREFENIAGKDETVTTHKEFGCMYQMDVRKVYFSPRLSFEHERIASQVKEGETVVDMFAGVGPFSVLIAKRVGKVKVYAIDANQDAIRFLNENIVLNNVQGKVTPILGDAGRVIKEHFVGKVDRAIMNLPEQAIGFVESACKSLKPAGGVVHYYSFAIEPDPLARAKEDLEKAILKGGRNISFLNARTVKSTAPYEWQVAIDAKVE